MRDRPRRDRAGRDRDRPHLGAGGGSRSPSPGTGGGRCPPVGLAVFGPAGFRGSANRSVAADGFTLRETEAPLGFLVGPIEPGTWIVVLSTGEILNDGVENGYLTWQLEATARVGERRDVKRP